VNHEKNGVYDLEHKVAPAGAGEVDSTGTGVTGVTGIILGYVFRVSSFIGNHGVG